MQNCSKLLTSKVSKLQAIQNIRMITLYSMDTRIHKNGAPENTVTMSTCVTNNLLTLLVGDRKDINNM